MDIEICVPTCEEERQNLAALAAYLTQIYYA
jgi:hypothetical protein